MSMRARLGLVVIWVASLIAVAALAKAQSELYVVAAQIAALRKYRQKK